MSTSDERKLSPEGQPKGPQFVRDPLTLGEIAALLIRHYELREGLYDINIEFKIGVGGIGSDDNRLPGALVAVSRIGLSHASIKTHATVDAATLAPLAEKKPPRPTGRRQDTPSKK